MPLAPVRRRVRIRHGITRWLPVLTDNWFVFLLYACVLMSVAIVYLH
jgi:hypothetical protein